MSKIKFFKDSVGGKLAVKQFKKKLITVVIKKTMLTFIFSDGTTKKIELKESQVEALSKSGKVYEYSEDENKIMGIKSIKIIE